MTEILKKNQHEIVEMSPYDIVVDEERHPRAEIYELTIYEYAEALEKGTTLPPIDIYSDGKVYLLADGYYRLAAYKLAEFDLIPAIVHQGDRREALIHALGSNTMHGRRRTNADKEKAVTIALTDCDISGTSNNQIAIICGTSQPYVGKIRKKLTCNGYKFGTTRVCSDGRIMDVSDIGANGAPVSAPVQPDAPVVGDNNVETVPEPVEPEVPEVGDNNDEVTEPSDPEDIELVDDQDPDPEDNVDAGPVNNNPDDVATPPELGSGDDDQDLDIDLEDDPDAEETDPEVDSGDAVDTDTEGDASGDDDTDSEEQDLDLEEPGDDEDDPDISDLDEIDLEDAVDVDTEGDAPGDNTDAEAQDLNLDGSEGDEENLEADDTDESETAEIDPDLVLDEDDLDTDDNLATDDDENDTDALKLQIVILQGLTKKQEEELKIKDTQIVELGQQVEKLEADNLYLKRELHARSETESDASASLDINSMNEDAYSMA